MKRVKRTEQLRLARRVLLVWRAELRRQSTLAERRVKRRPGPTLLTKIEPPAVFSFSKNYAETVRCLRELKQAVFADAPRGKKPEIFLDLSSIQSISLAGALALGAEIHRWRVYCGSGLRARSVANWNPKVRRLLWSLGFFKLLRVRLPRRMQREVFEDEVTVLEMISSTELDQELLQTIMKKLNVVADVLSQDPSVYGALVEAAYNAKLHAYPEEHDYEFPPLIRGWWATASWSPRDECVKFLVYDQGVGIPATLPRWSGWENIRAKVAESLGGLGVNLRNASNLIAAAIEMDRTSLQGGHGKGLQDVIAAVETTPGSSVRILSGTGRIIYHHGGRMEKKDEALHIGGTLVEWRIPVGPYEER